MNIEKNMLKCFIEEIFLNYEKLKRRKIQFMMKKKISDANKLGIKIKKITF